MKRTRDGICPWVILLVVTSATATASADGPPLNELFEAEVAWIEAHPLQGATSAAEWKARRPELQHRLRSMMGLDPEPERCDLQARVTGTVEQPDFVVEKLVFRSAPGLYVTANLYRPKVVKGRLPAILYVCGHAGAEKDGVIIGSKAVYQHHAEWFAANGYVCLIVDTLQLGELPGIHHGTYNRNMWWWQSRGYTPAGVEAWNGIRAIDYLCSRPDVDPERIGVTGRSGGGATSWWLGALDDRVKAVVPAAGITDLRAYVVSPWPDGHRDAGVIEGHCDCMFFVNTDRWDFTTLAALVAPKALLIENTNHDPIFPEPGVRRIFTALEKVYDWYGERDQLGMLIGEGGHIDSPELRHAAFAFFEKTFKGKNVAAADIAEPDRKLPVEKLKVLEPGELPSDCHNATIHEEFVKPFTPPGVPSSIAAWRELRAKWMKEVQTEVFGGWPSLEEAGPLSPKTLKDVTRDGIRVRIIEYSSEPGLKPLFWLIGPESSQSITQVKMVLPGGSEWWKEHEPELARGIEDEQADWRKTPFLDFLMREALAGKAQAIVVTRGIHPLDWPEAKDTHIRRRFALIGQTLDGMRVWDARRALAALREVGVPSDLPVEIHGHHAMSAVALWTAVFEPEIQKIVLADPPTSVHDGPAFLNLERILDMPQALALLHPREVVLVTANPSAWLWPHALDAALTPGRDWPQIVAPK